MIVLLPEEKAKKLPAQVFEIFNKFSSAGYEIYLVGAGVRNLFLDRPIENCDFTTDAVPEKIQEIIPESFYDNCFGTVATIIKTKNGEEKYEITTYRSEKGYTDKRRPDQVSWGKTLEEDLKRRDFTMNAMVVGPVKTQNSQPTTQNIDFELIDLFNGQEDLDNKIIRAVGNAEERFSEDALRMMRAVRFASQLGFVIETLTFEAIKKNAKLLVFISKERVKEELFKILGSDFPSEGIIMLLTAGLLENIIPELIAGYGLSQAKHHIYDVWNHSLVSLKKCPSKEPLVRLACLIHDIGKPIVVRGEGESQTFYNHEMAGSSIAKVLAKRLKFSKKEEERLVNLVRWHMFTVDDRQTDSAIRRFIRNVGKENLDDILAVRIGDRLGGGAKKTSWRLEKFKERLVEVQYQPFSVADLKINGNDVMDVLKLKSGPEVGQILKELFAEVEEQKLENEREILLKRLGKFKN